MAKAREGSSEPASVSNSSSNPLSEPQPEGVAADGQHIAEALERIAVALEKQRSVIQSLRPESLSYQDAGDFIGRDAAAIRHLVEVRKLPFVQCGDQRGRVILVEDLRSFLKKHRQPSGEEMLSRKHRA